MSGQHGQVRFLSTEEDSRPGAKKGVGWQIRWKTMKTMSQKASGVLGRWKPQVRVPQFDWRIEVASRNMKNRRKT